MVYHILNMENTSLIYDLFSEVDDVAVVSHHDPDRARLLQLIPDYDVYFCSLKVPVNREILDAAARLKVIVTPSTGLDHIDVEYAARKDMHIISLKDDRSFLDQLTATAELSWGLLLGVVRKIPWSFADALQGKWARDRYRGMQLSGKTLGILGYGRLGSMVARYGQAFGMEVIACDLQPIAGEDVEQVEFHALLERSDILSVHIHLTADNVRLLGKEAFARMKSGAVLVNSSRGAIIDEEALLHGLLSGQVAAAGLDVIDGEWGDDLANHPLIRYAREHENLLISPHIGGITFESNIAAYRHSIGKLKQYLIRLAHRQR